jgi:hypothetical protein
LEFALLENDLVDIAVAVVINLVADFRRARVDVRVGIIAIKLGECTRLVGRIAIAIAIIINAGLGRDNEQSPTRKEAYFICPPDHKYTNQEKDKETITLCCGGEWNAHCPHLWSVHSRNSFHTITN